MLNPLSSRSMDPRLTAASGVLRDAVGAIHNLQHLLGSTKVGPRALSRVIPDVRSACRPAMAAAEELVKVVQENQPREPVAELGRIITSRMADLEQALATAKRFTAVERLTLEQAVQQSVRDLDGALELVDLLVESSATSWVSLDATDVIRESAARMDTGSGRGRKIKVRFVSHGDPMLIRANPRVAVRLFAFVAGLATRKENGARVSASSEHGRCRLDVIPEREDGDGFAVLVPPLIALTEPFVQEVAKIVGADVNLSVDGRSASLTFPLAAAD